MLTILMALLAGCGGSDLVFNDTFDPDHLPKPSTDDTDVVITEPPGIEDCDWVGTYELASVKCGETNYSDWRNTFDTTTLVISHNRDGGCDFVLSLQNDNCVEENTFYADPNSDHDDNPNTIQFKDQPKDDMAYGVTSCNPDGCKFGGGDPDPCTIGGHASPVVSLVDTSVSDVLSFTNLGAFAAWNCDYITRTTWQKL